MTHKSVYLFLLLVLFYCKVSAQLFTISIDTLNIDIKQIANRSSRIYLTDIVKYKDEYYCAFSEKGLYNFKVEKKYFLILSTTGEILHAIEFPQSIKNSYYFDFFAQNNILIIKDYYTHSCFSLDQETLQWKRIREVYDNVYEDDNFIITYLNFGEWGQSTWFIDKHTNNEYILGVKGTDVNFIKGKYYFTSGNVVYEIDNPFALYPCENNYESNEFEVKQVNTSLPLPNIKKNYRYEDVCKNNALRFGTGALDGVKTIYIDTNYNYIDLITENFNQTIITSFVCNNELYQLYNDSFSSYIGTIINGKIQAVQNLGKKFSFFNDLYSYQGNNYNNNRLLKFSENENVYGIIEINNNQVNIHYIIHNLDSLEYTYSEDLGTLVNLLLLQKDSLHLNDIFLLEKEIKGVDTKDVNIGINHNGYYPEKYKSQNVKTKSFIHVEDSIIAESIEYLYSNSNQQIKSIFIEWTITEPYSTNTYSFIKENPIITKRFNNKQNEIIKILTDCIGITPKKVFSENVALEYSWILKMG